MKKEYKGFAAFILTHGRPDRVHTYQALRKSGYTGPIYLLVDDEDSTAEEYKAKYGNEVVIFSKSEAASKLDIMDNRTEDKRAITYARNASYDVARRLGLTYFLQLDDDYLAWKWRYGDNQNHNSRTPTTHRLDALIIALLKFYKKTPFASIAFAQGGDFMGGHNSGIGNAVIRRRKCMNSFFCSVDRPVKFKGRMNEDVNAYVGLGSQGVLFLTVPNVSLEQKATQSNDGSLTELYAELGTYPKSFASVMVMPSAVKVSFMGEVHRRMHHHVKWRHAVPMIIKEQPQREK